MSNPGPSESRGSSASSASSASSGSRAFLLAASLVVVIGCSIGSGSGGNGFAPTGGNGGTGVGGSLVPVVNSITPPQATPGATVTIAGENLVDPGATAITQNLHLANPVPTQVFFNLEQAVITSATATEIRVTVPPGLPTGKVVIFVGENASNEVDFMNTTPEVLSTPEPFAEEGIEYRYQVMAQDALGQSLAFALETGPAGMTVNTSTGLVTWTPTAMQSGSQHPVEVSIAQVAGQTRQTWTVTVDGAQFEAQGVADAGIDLNITVSRALSAIDGAQLSIPTGAATEEVVVSISAIQGDPLFVPAAAMQLQPNGTSFVNPVSVTLPFTTQNLNELGVSSANDLDLITVDEETGIVEALSDVTVDTINGFISGTAIHFSRVGFAHAPNEARLIVRSHGFGGSGFYQRYRNALQSIHLKDLIPETTGGAVRLGEKTCVIVHGLFAHQRDHEGANDLIAFATAHYDRVLFFSYRSSRRIRDAALALLLEMSVDENSEFDILTHGTGGLVARAALFLDNEIINGRFAGSARRLLLLGCPNLGARTPLSIACAALQDGGFPVLEDIIDLSTLDQTCVTTPRPITLALRKQIFPTTSCVYAIAQGTGTTDDVSEGEGDSPAFEGMPLVSQTSAFEVPGIDGSRRALFPGENHRGIHVNLTNLVSKLKEWGFTLRADPPRIELVQGQELVVRLRDEGTPVQIDSFTTSGAAYTASLATDRLSMTVNGIGDGVGILKIRSLGCITSVPVIVVLNGQNPTITDVDPSSGPRNGGTAITLTGTNFFNVTGVKVGGVPATNVAEVTNTQVTAVAPPSISSGSKDVILVSATNGTGTATAGFTYANLPVVTNVSPTSGALAGGEAVQITGTNFSGMTTVLFGSIQATGVSVNASETMITCAAPTGIVPGPVSISVISSDSGQATRANVYTYLGTLDVAGATPVEGPLAGGTPVVLSGSQFFGSIQVTFGATQSTSVTISPGKTSLVTLTPTSGVTGSVDITVTSDSNGSDVLTGGFTYNPLPTTTSVTPNEGPLAGGTPVVIFGTGYRGVVGVTVGGNPASGVSVNSGGTQISLLAPTSPVTGSVDVVVNSSTAGSVTSGGAFTYNPPPVISGVTPTQGPIAGGGTLTIDGSEFGRTVNVSMAGGQATNVTLNPTETQITCTIPAATGPGVTDIILTSLENGSVTTSAAFTYLPLPTTSGISPTSGDPDGGTSVTIDGANFGGTVNVSVGAGLASGVSVSPADDQITFTAPIGTPGARDVIIMTGENGTLNWPGAFTFNPMMTTDLVTPATGDTGGGEPVILTGTNYFGPIDVRFGAFMADVTSVNVSGTRIDILTPTVGPSNAAIFNIEVISSTHGDVITSSAFLFHN